MAGEIEDRARAAVEAKLREEAIARIYRGLSPEAMRALHAVSEMRNRPPEEVLREELQGYILEKLPPVDIEGIIRTMAGRFYQLGFLCGTARRFVRDWNRSHGDG
ncbi:hypothetical protein [Sutterella sp.]|uniref:hypothetical protein n=1 Tax=Sutterella sp. TaxID=1981025 RepID=UPI0026DFA9CD|nr:hypothetical protein [Sutterella sp.]MDO5531178.1 hypothetical protein [Sutterella sp.]